MMTLPQDYILVLDEQRQHLPQSESPVASEQYTLVIAASEEQALAQARQTAPCLVILVGNSHAWLKHQVYALRRSTATATALTIVALTESTAPNWHPHEEALDLDGFLVKPLTDDILNSLVQSAIIKQSYR